MAISNGTSIAPQLPGMRAADNITIEDAGGYYISGNVEGALQEAGVKLAGITDHIVGARFGRTSAQAYTHDTPVDIQWNDRPYNPDGSHDSDLTRMVCRVAGVYTVSYRVGFIASVGDTTPK